MKQIFLTMLLLFGASTNVFASAAAEWDWTYTYWENTQNGVEGYIDINKINYNPTITTLQDYVQLYLLSKTATVPETKVKAVEVITGFCYEQYDDYVTYKNNHPTETVTPVIIESCLTGNLNSTTTQMLAEYNRYEAYKAYHFPRVLSCMDYQYEDMTLAGTSFLLTDQNKPVMSAAVKTACSAYMDISPSLDYLKSYTMTQTKTGVAAGYSLSTYSFPFDNYHVAAVVTGAYGISECPEGSVAISGNIWPTNCITDPASDIGTKVESLCKAAGAYTIMGSVEFNKYCNLTNWKNSNIHAPITKAPKGGPVTVTYPDFLKEAAMSAVPDAIKDVSYWITDGVILNISDVYNLEKVKEISTYWNSTAGSLYKPIDINITYTNGNAKGGTGTYAFTMTICGKGGGPCSESPFAWLGNHSFKLNSLENAFSVNRSAKAWDAKLPLINIDTYSVQTNEVVVSGEYVNPGQDIKNVVTIDPYFSSISGCSTSNLSGHLRADTRAIGFVFMPTPTSIDPTIETQAQMSAYGNRARKTTGNMFMHYPKHGVATSTVEYSSCQ